MNFLSGLLNGLNEIWSHKMRSFLTLTCILLGVASVVLTVGFINGLFANWNQWLAESGGLEKIAIIDATPPEEQRRIQSRSPGKTRNDLEIIRENSRYANAISPELDLEEARLQRGSVTYRTRIQGCEPAIFQINRLEVAQGRKLTDLDGVGMANVVVLGSTVARKLFKPGEEPLGAVVRINGLPCEVVGILRHYAFDQEDLDEWNPLEGLKNNVAFMPLSTLQWKLLGHRPLTWLNVQVNDVGRLREAVDELQNMVRASHRGIADFRVQTAEDELQSLDEMRGNFMLIGMIVGGVTLVIGGISIMNLMLASISERVREIGIRKALGAWDEDVFLQFMTESVTLSLAGGSLGVVAGCGVIQLLRVLPELSVVPEISISAVIVGFVFSVVIGIVSGIYPALVAARLDPIDALRFE